jgi:exonuclease VII large subunit
MWVSAMSNSDQLIRETLWSEEALSQEALSVSSFPPEEPDPVLVIQELCECNQSLMNRITSLETALAYCRQHSQQTDDSLHLSGLFTDPPVEAAQVETLLQGLAVAHKVAQKQQGLVEALMTELEKSQSRIAQLERECARHQQRYHEQTHQLIQADQNYRELQSRLQRQQYHTLQLKAALEKALEQDRVLQHVERPNFTRAENEQLLTSKVSPVQPWSISTDEIECEESWYPAQPQSWPVVLEPTALAELTVWREPSDDELQKDESETHYATLSNPADCFISSSCSSTQTLRLPPLSRATQMIQSASTHLQQPATAAKDFSFVINPQRFVHVRQPAAIDLPLFLRSRR